MREAAGLDPANLYGFVVPPLLHARCPATCSVVTGASDHLGSSPYVALMIAVSARVMRYTGSTVLIKECPTSHA